MAQTTRFSTVGDVVADMPNLSTFNNLLRRSGVIAEVESGGDYTVFAPTNAAFDRLPPHAIGELVREPHTLEDFVRNHIISGRFAREGLAGEGSLPTLVGGELTVVDVQPGPYVGGARVVDGDIAADSGIVHVIDAVLMPQQS